jgi:hypothetical protein
MEGECQVLTFELNCTGQDSGCRHSPERSPPPHPYAAMSDRVYVPRQKSYLLQVLFSRGTHPVERR